MWNSVLWHGQFLCFCVTVYRLVLLEEHPAVQRHVLPVPQLHPGVVIILEVSGEDALPWLAQHRVQPGVWGSLGGDIACKEEGLSGYLWYLWEPQIKLSCQQSLFRNFMACLIQIINGGKPLTLNRFCPTSLSSGRKRILKEWMLEVGLNFQTIRFIHPEKRVFPQRNFFQFATK